MIHIIKLTLTSQNKALVVIFKPINILKGGIAKNRLGLIILMASLTAAAAAAEAGAAARRRCCRYGAGE